MESFNNKFRKLLKIENIRLLILTAVLVATSSAFVLAGDLKIQADKQSFKEAENKAKFTPLPS